jgi:TRAP-type mannitol/chloroaromatic compound transport system permease large subunit
VLDPATTGVIVFIALFVMLAVGVHIGVALGLGGLLGMYLTIGPDAAFAQLATIPFSTTNSFTLAVIPLFILMGALSNQAGLTSDLYRAAYNWLGRLPGGLAMATTMASAAFGAACGSMIVNAAVFTRMAMPEMTKFGYDKRLSAGCIAASGTLASLIPPSILNSRWHSSWWPASFRACCRPRFTSPASTSSSARDHPSRRFPRSRCRGRRSGAR